MKHGHSERSDFILLLFGPVYILIRFTFQFFNNMLAPTYDSYDYDERNAFYSGHNSFRKMYFVRGKRNANKIQADKTHEAKAYIRFESIQI